jgi:hypothetical protein
MFAHPAAFEVLPLPLQSVLSQSFSPVLSHRNSQLSYPDSTMKSRRRRRRRSRLLQRRRRRYLRPKLRSFALLPLSSSLLYIEFEECQPFFIHTTNKDANFNTIT